MSPAPTAPPVARGVAGLFEAHRARALTFCLLAIAGCAKDFTPPVDTARLPIADRQWDEGAPPEGWCGETSIQMAALHFGAWFPQAHVNAVGRTKHVDLWEEDVPGALTKLGLRFQTGPRARPARLLAWAVEALRRGHPVILGVKLPPTEHPEWQVDHLVLAVGFTPTGLLINTNLEPGQVEAPWRGLQEPGGARGLSLINPSGETFGFEVEGFGGDLAVEARVVTQTDARVTLELRGTSLQPGARYELLRNEVPLRDFDGASVTLEQDAGVPARYSLRVLPRDP